MRSVQATGRRRAVRPAFGLFSGRARIASDDAVRRGRAVSRSRRVTHATELDIGGYRGQRPQCTELKRPDGRIQTVSC